MLNFADASGNLMNRLGRLGKVLDDLRPYQASLETDLIDETDGIVGQFNAEPDIQAQVGASYISQLNAPGGVAALLQSVAAITVSRMVFRDSPRYNQNLTQQTVLSSLQDILYQMKQQGATVLACTITATPTPFTANNLNTGNGAVVTSIRRPIDGVVLENAFAEDVQILCTADSYIGGATEGNEGFTITGEGNEPNTFAFDWPLGSNANVTTNAIDGDTNQGSGNLLTSFVTWTSNVPDGWVLDVGTAGTNLIEETSLTFGTSSAAQIVGDGSTLVQLSQEFEQSSTGTAASLSPLSQYGFNVWVRRDGTAPAAGVLAVELVDGGGAIIQDEAGNNCQFTIDLTTLSTVYTPYGGAFRTPHIMPDAYAVQFRMLTALSNGRKIYLAKPSLGAMFQLGVNQIFMAVYSGSIPFVNGDFTVSQTTNSRGVGGSLSTFQTLLWLLLPDWANNELLLPSSATPTISDQLITR